MNHISSAFRMPAKVRPPYRRRSKTLADEIASQLVFEPGGVIVQRAYGILPRDRDFRRRVRCVVVTIGQMRGRGFVISSTEHYDPKERGPAPPIYRLVHEPARAAP